MVQMSVALTHKSLSNLEPNAPPSKPFKRFDSCKTPEIWPQPKMEEGARKLQTSQGGVFLAVL